MRPTVVTASDANFFDMLWNMVLSVKRNAPAGGVGVAVIDLGLTPEQRADLSGMVERIVAAEWDIRFPFTDELPAYKKAFTLSPFLPRYLPDADPIVWIDADAWIQDEGALSSLIEAAEAAHLAIAPEVHHCYPDAVSRAKVRVFNGPILDGRVRRISTWARTQLSRRYGRRIANETLFKPTFNAGVFAARRDSPVWSAWERAYRTARIRRPRDLSDQAPINYAIRAGEVRVNPLPATLNWICDLCSPLWDPENEVLVTPSVPHERIGIVHVLGQSKSAGQPVLQTDGGRAPVDIWGQKVPD